MKWILLARQMIMNKATTVHTCNACNKTLRKIQYLKKHIKAENVHTLIKKSAEKQTLNIATQIVSQCSYKRQYCFQRYYTSFTYSAMVHHKEICHDKKVFECPECEMICCSTA